RTSPLSRSLPLPPHAHLLPLSLSPSSSLPLAQYECHCLLIHCESSRCRASSSILCPTAHLSLITTHTRAYVPVDTDPTKKAIVVLVLASVSLLGVCMPCC